MLGYQMVPPFLQPYILKTRRCMEVKEDSVGVNEAQILLDITTLIQAHLRQ